MLKIKDEVDLKELEEFGFEYFRNGCGTYGYHLPNGSYWGTIVEFDNEKLGENEERIIHDDMPNDILFDLIQAGLVEKV